MAPYMKEYACPIYFISQSGYFCVKPYFMNAHPTVNDYMIRSLHTLKADTDIFDAVDFLLKYKISGAPVIDRNDRVVGMLSEKDCLSLLHDADGKIQEGLKVADLMSKKVETILPETDIYSASARFIQTSYRRFPVVGKDGILKGQIRRKDILRAIQENIRSKNMKTQDLEKQARVVDKEVIQKLTFLKGDVLASHEEQNKRLLNLEKAARLGNIEKQKVNIIFSADGEVCSVSTTVWAVENNFLSLKGEIFIPINRIYSVVF